MSSSHLCPSDELIVWSLEGGCRYSICVYPNDKTKNVFQENTLYWVVYSTSLFRVEEGLHVNHRGDTFIDEM